MDNLAFPEGIPVTKQESVSFVAKVPNQTIADIYLNPASDHDVNVNGPFEQTLFLGCSIVNFNVNLGWGGENSTLTVTLVEDDSYHWNDPISQFNTNTMANELSLPGSWEGYATNPGTSDTRPGFNTIGPNTNQSLNPNFYPGAVGPTGFDVGLNTTMFPQIPTAQDTRKDWFKTIYDKEIRLDIERKSEQAILNDPRLSRGDFGKVYYELLENGSYIKKYWTKPDPGFVGKTYDIFGVAVRFIFHDFEFAGLVSSWKSNAGQGGFNQYTVEIKSFAGLLSNTQLIIDHYAGSIFTKLPENDYPPVFAEEGLGLPSNDIGNRYGKITSSEYSSSISQSHNSKDRYIGTITQGNLTNVFNIYGYIETTVGFGKNDINELGTKISDIYAGIQDLISYTPPFGEDESSVGGYKIGIIDARFSPYGRIIGKAPALTKLPNLSPNVESGTFNVLYLQDTYKIISPKEADLLYVKELPLGNNSLSPPFFYQTLEVSAQKYGASQGYKLNEAGVIPVQKASDEVYRQHYTLDLSELPPIPTDDRIKGPVISITDLVDHVCSQANYDWFVDFSHINNQIKIRTISRQKQPSNNYIEHLLLSAAGSSSITAYDYGVEFNDSATVRSVYIGAKQKRLLQISSNFLANKNNALVFDPYDNEGAGFLLFHSIKNISNTVRIPDHLSVRNLHFPYYSDKIFNVGSGTGSIIWEPYDYGAWHSWNGVKCGKGNYLDPIDFGGPNYDAVDDKGNSSDIFTDLGYVMYTKYTYLNGQNTNNIILLGSDKEPFWDPRLGVTDFTEDPFVLKEQGDVSKRVYYNYPLWDEFICPYFGLDVDGTARKVFYDTGMRQIQVLCSVGDLQNALGFRLTSEISFPISGVVASPWENPLASTGTSQQSSAPLPYDSNNPQSVGQAIGSNVSNTVTRQERNISWNINKREFYEYDTKFLLTENEIRSAIAGFDSWMEYTFNKNFTTDLGEILRKTIFAQSGSIVQSTEGSEIGEAARVNAGRDYPVNVVFNGIDVGIISDTSSESPNVSKADVLKSKIKSTLDIAFNYVKEIGSTYYGKQYMVKIPGLSISRDRIYSDRIDMDISLSNETYPVNAYEAGGEYYSSYKPSTDGAWEEIGNIIDDTIAIGSTNGDFFRESDGKYGPILGFNASYEYLKDTIDESLLSPVRPDPNAGNEVSEIYGNALQVISTTGGSFKNFQSPGSNAGATSSSISQQFSSTQTVTSNNSSVASAAPITTAMLYALSSQPATGTDIIPNEFYASLITSLSDNEYLYYSYPSPNQQSFLPSFAKFDNLSKTTSNKDIPMDLVYKLYAKAEIEENYVFINALSRGKRSALNTRPEGREPRAILKLGSEVVCNPVHLADKFLGHCLRLDAALFKTEGASVPYDVAGEKVTRVYNYEIKSDDQIVQSLVNYYQNGQPISINNVTQKQANVEFIGTTNGGMLPFDGGFGIGNPLSVVKIVTDHLLTSINSSSSSTEEKSLTMPIAPKAAMPGFAAVPLESQTAVYGPWTNQPHLLKNEIFTDEDLKDQPAALKDSIENLVGGLKVQVAEDLAPWRFGGMNALDAHVISKIQNDAAYQLQIEQGTIDIPGAPSYKLGDFLNKTSEYAGGPIINNISANIDKGGITTKYSFRTFNKKFSMYNKENADRLAKINSEAIQRRRDLAFRSAAITNRRAVNRRTQNLNNYGSVDYVNPAMPLSWRSASELLVGHNELSFRLPPVEDSKDPQAPVAIMSGLINDIFEFDLGWGYKPIFNIDSSNNSRYDVVDFPKIFSQSKIMDSREAPKELSANYENTSLMSLDGLLSPISFYPTQNFSTYHITKYDRRLCRYCLGKGTIIYSSNVNNIPQIMFKETTDGISNLKFQNQVSSRSIPCPFCEPITNKISGILTSSKNGRMDPPFIIATGIDAINSLEFSSTGNNLVTLKTNSAIINHTTLNPIVMSHGEFSIFQNRQNNDFTGHSIKMVGQGTIAPEGPNDSLNQQMCGNNRLLKSFLDYDQLFIDKVQQIYDIPENQRTETITSLINQIGQNNPIPFANNARFFGFRGPMMLHGWGYDTEGYPVPNASGDFMYAEPSKIDSSVYTDNEKKKAEKLSVVRVRVLEDGKVKYIYQNQKFIRKDSLDQEKLKDLDVKWVKFDNAEGYFTEPYKEHKFAKGWAQIPSTWPVGPIDLRWDQKAKVWTVPATYRNAYVLLEEDLNNNIARGELIDNNTDSTKSPFAVGYRKMVFVKDVFGIYTAPRSAVIYCAYDVDSGYYEPISQNSFVTSGTIISSNTASMSKIFKRKVETLLNSSFEKSEDLNFVATFTNPLDIPIDPGDVALFTYLQNGWIVQASRG